MVGFIELIFYTRAILGSSHSVLKENLSVDKNNGTSLWNFVPTLDVAITGIG